MIPANNAELVILEAARGVLEGFVKADEKLDFFGAYEYRLVTDNLDGLTILLEEIASGRQHGDPRPPAPAAPPEETRFFPRELAPVDKSALVEPYHDLRAQAVEDLARSMRPACPDCTRINDAADKTLAVAQIVGGHLTGSNGVALCSPQTIDANRIADQIEQAYGPTTIRPTAAIPTALLEETLVVKGKLQRELDRCILGEGYGATTRTAIQCVCAKVLDDHPGFVVGIALHNGLGERHVQRLRDRLGEGAVRVAGQKLH